MITSPFFIVKEDCLARSVSHLHTIYDDLESRGVKFGAPNRLNDEQVVEMRKKREDGAIIKDFIKDTVYQKHPSIG